MLETDRIYNMDCIEGMKQIPDKSIDMILCDLPYGTTSRNPWDNIIPFDILWEQYKRIIKTGGSIILTALPPFSFKLWESNKDWFRYEWIWIKNNSVGFLNANRCPLRQHEVVMVFCEKQTKYNPQGLKHGIIKPQGSTSTNYGEHSLTYESNNLTNYPTDILYYDNFNGNTFHPTQKPVALFEYLIRTYTDEGETVLDNCMGSGTTAIACINSNRHYIGFELNKEYYDKAIERISKHSVKQKAKRTLDEYF